MRVPRAFTLIELMIVIAIIAIIAAIAIPGLLNAIRASNERNASGSLKTIATAQSDFRANDRDLNRVNDFWTGDVAGLYAIANVSTGTPAPQPIKLIEITLALAELFPLPPGSLANGNYPLPIIFWGTLSAKAGYWYASLGENLQISANGGNGLYRQDTDGTGDLVHNTSSFGAAALPESYNGTGRFVFIINEGNTMFRRDPGAEVLDTSATPPNSTGVFPGDWPLDADLAASWSKMD